MLVALLSLTALCVLAILLALGLFHVRYRVTWNGTWNGLAATDDPAFPHVGSFRLDVGFPGFMKSLTGASKEAVQAESAPPDAAPPTSAQGAPSPAARSAPVETVETGATIVRPAPAEPVRSSDPSAETPGEAQADEPPSSREPEAGVHEHGTKDAHAARPDHPGSDRNRWRRALFRVATDAPAWKLVRRFATGTARRAVRLLGLRVAVTVGHPDPARLGRAAGTWYAIAPLSPLTRGLKVEFRFQDRHPTLDLRAEGACSALSLLAFGGALVVSFPWIGLGRRAWYGWRNSVLTGWRAWTYAKIQKL